LTSSIKFSNSPTYNYGISAKEFMRIDSNGNIGIGSSSDSMRDEEYIKWMDILTLAETNPALQEALDRVKVIYYLSKDHGNKT
jgi:hypothetical protein